MGIDEDIVISAMNNPRAYAIGLIAACPSGNEANCKLDIISSLRGESEHRAVELIFDISDEKLIAEIREHFQCSMGK